MGVDKNFMHSLSAFFGNMNSLHLYINHFIIEFFWFAQLSKVIPAVWNLFTDDQH